MAAYSLPLVTLGKALVPPPRHFSLLVDGLGDWFQKPGRTWLFSDQVREPPRLHTPAVTRPSGWTSRRGYRREGVPELEPEGDPGLGGQEEEERRTRGMYRELRGRRGFWRVEWRFARGRTGGEAGWDGTGPIQVGGSLPSPHCPASPVCPAGIPSMPGHTRLSHPSLYAFMGGGGGESLCSKSPLPTWKIPTHLSNPCFCLLDPSHPMSPCSAPESCPGITFITG